MMIPPVPRLGYPTEPQANGVEYVCLVKSWGWRMLRWTPQLGFHTYEVLYPGSNGLCECNCVLPEDILCWFPQDGT